MNADGAALLAWGLADVITMYLMPLYANDMRFASLGVADAKGGRQMLIQAHLFLLFGSVRALAGLRPSRGSWMACMMTMIVELALVAGADGLEALPTKPHALLLLPLGYLLAYCPVRSADADAELAAVRQTLRRTQAAYAAAASAGSDT